MNEGTATKPTHHSGNSSGPAKEFLDLWLSGASDEVAHSKLRSILSSCELTGRVIHGFPNDPGFGKLLSSDDWKRLSWVFGPDALYQFLGKSAREICLLLGFGESWLDGKLRHGKLFKLCIFPSKSVSATMATWDGVQILLQESYPEVWPEKIQPHYKAIQSMDISSIQQLASYNMEAANFVGRDPATGESTDPNYMTLQRLQTIESPTLVQVRQFLWDEIGLKKLFRGDGHTYNDHGQQGAMEYLAKQMRLEDIQGAVIQNINPAA